MAKTMAAILATLFVISVFVSATVAATSPAGGADVLPPPMRVPANPYSRGCSKAQRCRGGDDGDDGNGGHGGSRKLLTTKAEVQH